MQVGDRKLLSAGAASDPTELVHTARARFDPPTLPLLPCHGMLTIAYYTLGCKVNQYETEKIREALERAGFATVPFSSPADAYVINTCSVTHVADRKSRAAVHRALRANPDAYVVITGCYSQLDPARLRAIDGVDLVVGNDGKDAIPEQVSARLRTGLVEPAREGDASVVIRPRLRTRAIVKVQDGCDHFCAYCAVPYARAGRRSRPMSDALAEIRALAGCGYREIVLTGIRLGSYDDGGNRLPELIRAVSAVDGVERIRLSSIEPWEVDDALLEAMAHGKVCRHLHIPLQSGDDEVLRRMGRPYTRSGFVGTVRRVRERIPGIGITTDVIAGFPGETDEEFENTCRAIEDVQFSRLHVFRYSPRRLTRAAAMANQVSAGTKKARAEKLSELGETAMRTFAKSLVGETVEVLVERRAASRTHTRDAGESLGGSKHVAGFADNYVEVTFPGDPSVVGKIVRVRISGVAQDGRAIGSMEEVS